MVRTLYEYIWKVSRRQQLGLSLLAGAIVLLELVPLELQRRIVNEAVEGRDYSHIGVLCLIYVGVVLMHGVTKLVMNVYGATVGERINRQLRMQVDPTAAPKSGSKTSDGVAISIIVSEADAIGGFIATSFSAPVMNIGIMISVLGYMLYTQPWITPVVALVFLSQIPFLARLQGGINRRTTSRIKVMRAMSTEVVDKKSVEQGDEAVRGFRRRVGEIYRLSMQMFRRKYTMNFLMNLFHHLGVAGILAVGSWLVLEGKTEVGTIVAFISGLGRMNDPWRDLVVFFQEVTNTGARFKLIAGQLHDYETHGGLNRQSQSSQTSHPGQTK